MSRGLFLAALLVVALAVTADAATLWVATNGDDTVAPACGKLTTPCRSINKALSLANDGDSITVLPGRYGAPTEAPAPGCASCLIDVNKRVTLTSRDGASETIIDAAGAGVVDVVSITANGVTLGRRLKGFSLVNGGNGLNIGTGVTGATVTGNQAGSNTAAGFEIDGDGAKVDANRAGGNGFSGFSVRGNGNKLTGNLAAGNAPHGFAVFESNHTLTGNISIDNALGFTIADEASNITLSGNAALGNLGPGVIIGLVGGAGVTNISVIKGSIFGNDQGGANCGLLNESSATINAINNFWGQAIGPSADPGDAVCNSGGGEVTFAPVGTREINPRSP